MILSTEVLSLKTPKSISQNKTESQMNKKREVEETVMTEDEKRNMDTKNWSLTSLANILSLSPDQQNRRDQVVSNSILNIYLKC